MASFDNSARSPMVLPSLAPTVTSDKLDNASVMERTSAHRVQPASRAMPVPTVHLARQACRVRPAYAAMLRR